MSRFGRMAVAGWLAMVAVAGVQPAYADPATCNDQKNACDIVVTVPGEKVANDPGKRVPPSSEKPTNPSWSSFRGGREVAQPGTSLADLPADTRPKAGWVRSSCLEGDGLRWVWSPPRVNAAAMARTLLAR